MPFDMRNIVYWTVIFLCLVLCQQKVGYKIVANWVGVPDGLKVYLFDDNREVLDSCLTEKGQFTFKGKVESPFLASVTIKTPGEMFTGRSFDFFLENSEIQIKGVWEDFYDMIITGSTLQDEYTAYQKQLAPLYDKLYQELESQMFQIYSQPLYNGNFTVDCIPPGIKIARQEREINKQMQEITFRFVESHSNSLVTLKILEDQFQVASNFSMEEVNKLLSGLSLELKQTKAYQALVEKINIYRETAIGEKYIDFRVVDMNGKEGMFSDYVQSGKYNMLEVWASWCGHCRVEIPHLKMVQEKYGDRFNIIAVSWDKDETEWRKAVNEDCPNYLQLRAVKDADGKDVGSYYHLRGIPYSLVIDGDGRIVTAQGRAAKLDLLLEELYDKQDEL